MKIKLSFITKEKHVAVEIADSETAARVIKSKALKALVTTLGEYGAALMEKYPDAFKLDIGTEEEAAGS